MVTKNWDRVLTDEQIKGIHEQLVILFRDDAEVLAEMVLNNYLAEDKNMLWANMVELIEQAEKGELLTIDQVNSMLRETNDPSYDY